MVPTVPTKYIYPIRKYTPTFQIQGIRWYIKKYDTILKLVGTVGNGIRKPYLSRVLGVGKVPTNSGYHEKRCKYGVF